MKILFAGTPEFAVDHLEALLKANFNVVVVLTKPDKPSGRGRKLNTSPIKQYAKLHELPVLDLKTLKDPFSERLIKDFDVDVAVDVAYGLIIPKNIFQMLQHGFINVHPSLLPRWRGPAPIQHAILSGDEHTGVTIMKIDEGIDTGPILSQKKYRIKPKDTTLSLSKKLAKIGSELLVDALKTLQEKGSLEFAPQPEEGMTHALKIEKTMAKINWNNTAVEIGRQIRAYNPAPIAFANLGNLNIRIWEATPLEESESEPVGTIIRFNNEGIDVATNNGVLRITQMQLPGGKCLPVSAILNGRKDFFEHNRKFT